MDVWDKRLQNPGVGNRTEMKTLVKQAVSPPQGGEVRLDHTTGFKGLAHPVSGDYPDG